MGPDSPGMNWDIMAVSIDVSYSLVSGVPRFFFLELHICKNGNGR